MAPHAYQSLEPGAQIVISDAPREDLEELARWETIPVDEAEKILKGREKPTTPKAPVKTAAEKKADKVAAEAEVVRIAALPIHVGDTVGLTAEAIALVADAEDATPEATETATAWRAVVTAVRRDDDADEDVAEFAESPACPIDSLVIDSTSKAE